MKSFLLRSRPRTAPGRCTGCIVSVCLAAFVITGCHRVSASSESISVQPRISPQPVHAGSSSTIHIQLANASAQPISHAQITVEGDMSHPGMAPVFADAAETLPGSYQAHINFNMPGDWIVLFHIKLPDGSRIERQLDVKGVQSN